MLSFCGKDVNLVYDAESKKIRKKNIFNMKRDFKDKKFISQQNSYMIFLRLTHKNKP